MSHPKLSYNRNIQCCLFSTICWLTVFSLQPSMVNKGHSITLCACKDKGIVYSWISPKPSLGGIQTVTPLLVAMCYNVLRCVGFLSLCICIIDESSEWRVYPCCPPLATKEKKICSYVQVRGCAIYPCMQILWRELNIIICSWRLKRLFWIRLYVL